MINDSYVRVEILVDPVQIIIYLMQFIMSVAHIRERIVNISRVNDGN